MSRTTWLVVSQLVLGVGVAVSAAAADTVEYSYKLGSNVEGMTFAPDGTYQDCALAMDGNDVIAVPLTARARRGRGGGDAAHPDQGNHYALGQLKHVRGGTFYKAFDLRALPPEWRAPRGIVYEPGRRRFYFSSVHPTAVAATQLQVMDERGAVLPPLTLDLDPTGWSNWEGMTWIPAGAPRHPGRIAALGHRDDFVAHVYFIDPVTGHIDEEVVPTASSRVATYLCGIGYHAGKLLVNDCGSEIFELSLTGELQHVTDVDPDTGFVSADPVLVSPDAGLESIIVDGTGTLYVTSYEDPILRAFTGAFVRAEAKDVAYSLGLGVSVGALGYDFDRDELLISTRAHARLVALPTTLRSARFLFDLKREDLPSPSGFAYQAGGSIVVANAFFPRGLATIDLATGQHRDRLVFFGPPGGAVGAAGPFDAEHYVVSHRAGGGPAEQTRLHLVNRAGVPHGDPDLAHYLRGVYDGVIELSEAKGGAQVQVFPTPAGPRILTGAKVFDLAGNLTHRFDAAALGMVDGLGGVVWIGGNRFAALDGDTSVVTVFHTP